MWGKSGFLLAALVGMTRGLEVWWKCLAELVVVSAGMGSFSSLRMTIFSGR
jgi:hypothetical protein